MNIKNKYHVLLASFLITAGVFGQSPEKMSYQALVRDADNELLRNQSVGMRISILQNATAVYAETHAINANVNGLVTLEIGLGAVQFGSFTNIDWSSGTYFIKTETDPTRGSSYTITGISQLLSVPYALYAKTSGNSTPDAQGQPGADGANGIDGEKGDKGLVGDTGAEGARGLSGIQGSRGIDGEKGDKGLVGDTGAEGAIGASGSQGSPGMDGERGNIGERGDAGTNGIDGEKGETGDAGAFPTGDNGDLFTHDGTNWVAKKPSIQAHESQNLNVSNPYLGIHYIIATQGTYPSRSSSSPFIAEIIMFGGDFAPRGWAFCDGQIISIIQNQALFSLIGTTYGGDGRTTFRLPDLRGRTPVHAGTGAGLSNVRLGEKRGVESITIPAQTHVITYE
jgi:microcystin-dependent protein